MKTEIRDGRKVIVCENEDCDNAISAGAMDIQKWMENGFEHKHISDYHSADGDYCVHCTGARKCKCQEETE